MSFTPHPALSNRVIPEISWFCQRFNRQLKGSAGTTLDLATAENWLIRDDILQLTRDAVCTICASDLSYAGGLGGPASLLGNAASFYNFFFKPSSSIEPNHLVAGPGASALLDSLLYCVCDADDTVLVEAPYWGSFEIYSTLRNRVRLKPVYPPRFGECPVDDEAYIAAFEEALRDAAPSRVKALLLCNPQNPQAQIFSKKRLESLLSFCHQHNLHLISDEVYALTAFRRDVRDKTMPTSTSRSTMHGADTFVSVAALDLERLGFDQSRLHILHSTSKDFGSSGYRMGFLITQANPSLRFALAILNHNRVSTLTCHVTAHLFSDLQRLDVIISQNASRLHNAASIVEQFLACRKIGFVRPTAGVYIWARLGQSDCTWEQEAKLTTRLLEAGVSVGNGTDYSAPQAGWFRLTFAIIQSDLNLALNRIASVLNDIIPVDAEATLPD